MVELVEVDELVVKLVGVVVEVALEVLELSEVELVELATLVEVLIDTVVVAVVVDVALPELDCDDDADVVFVEDTVVVAELDAEVCEELDWPYVPERLVMEVVLLPVVDGPVSDVEEIPPEDCVLLEVELPLTTDTVDTDDELVGCELDEDVVEVAMYTVSAATTRMTMTISMTSAPFVTRVSP